MILQTQNERHVTDPDGSSGFTLARSRVGSIPGDAESTNRYNKNIENKM